MAQSTSSTPSVTATDGFVRINRPFNRGVQDVRATPDTILISTGDLNKYPAINISISTGTSQFWVYDLGDTATRDADLALF